MDELTEGNLNPSQIAAFLACLNVKGVIPEEIAGFASVLRRKKTPLKSERPALDTCGTGGDELGTFNISSLSALVAASCGAVVAKHGNRGVSSKSGSADFYACLGIPLDLSPEKAAALLQRTGFTFLFAPLYHGAMKHAGPVRRELRLKTVMNVLGPLANPADAQYQLIGVFSEKLCVPVARAARLLGVKRVMVVHGRDRMDEISVSGPTRIVEIDEEGRERDYLFDPAELGIPRYEVADLAGGTPEQNAAEAAELVDGRGRDAVREAVQLNGGAALYVAGLAGSLAEGYGKAKTVLQTGEVKKSLDRIVREAKKLAASRQS
jgi:anthranilate synthase/phosphoribosyltransferase